MALPKYDKSKRKKTYETLPKGAYVIRILNVTEEANKKGFGTHLTIRFDIAEGEYENFFANVFTSDQREDKKWPNDGTFYLTVPDTNSQQYVFDNWNSFWADLEDSNNGWVFDMEHFVMLKGKLLGAKFAIEQTEYNGQIYDHTRMRWTCVADDVRNGKAGKMPADKLITPSAPASEESNDEWLKVDAIADELPF